MMFVEVRTRELGSVNQELVRVQGEVQGKEKELSSLHLQLNEAEKSNLEKSINLQTLQSQITGIYVFIESR